MSYVVKKPINDICLNDSEYLLEGPDGGIKEFPTAEEARTFIAEALFEGSKEDLDDSFIEIVKYEVP